MSIKLDNCAHCGSVAEFVFVGSDDDMHWVTCGSRKDCGIDIRIFPTKEEAAERWNRRVLPTCASCGNTEYFLCNSENCKVS